MKTRKLAYFDVSAEFFVERIKAVSNIPQDTSVVRVEADPPWRENFGQTNVIRIYAESNSFQDVQEGQEIPRYDIIAKNRGDIIDNPL